MQGSWGWDVAGVANKPRPQYSGSAADSDGSFMYHKQPADVTRAKHMPGYLGHRPLLMVTPPRPRSAEAWAAHMAAMPRSHSAGWIRPPHPREELCTHIVPGYTGVVQGSAHLVESSSNKLRTPNKDWIDNRTTARQYDNPLNSYRGDVNGIVPGYRGHMPGALRQVGSSNYGGLERRASMDKWSQGRHATHPAFEARETARFDFAAVVPAAASAAAEAAFQRGQKIRQETAEKEAAERFSALVRSKITTGFMEQGIMPGYKGHVPRYRDEVGNSPYKGNGVDKNTKMGLIANNEALRERMAALAVSDAHKDIIGANDRVARSSSASKQRLRQNSPRGARPSSPRGAKPSTPRSAAPKPKTPRSSATTPRGRQMAPRASSTPRSRKAHLPS